MRSIKHNDTWVAQLTEQEFLAVQHDALAHPENYHAGVKIERISDPGNEIKFFSASESLAQALTWYKTCWPYGMKLVKEIAPNIRPRLKDLAGQLAEVSRESLALSGRRLNMSAAIADTSPEHFYKESTANSAMLGNRKLVNLYVSISTPHYSEPKNLARFGLTLAEVISLLEAYNIARFQITLVEACRNYADGQKFISFLRIKNYHQTIPKSRLVTYLAAPFILRRFYFNLADRIPSLQAHNHSYGYPYLDDTELKSIIKPFVPAREPVNTLYSLANITSEPCLKTILQPLCQTLNLAHWLSSMRSES